MFELEPPRDLVLPSRASSTARAIHSIARRGLFERSKTLEPDARASASGRDAYACLHRTLASFLPGDPHLVSRVLDRPPVSVAMRMLRDGEGDPEIVLAELAAQGLFAIAAEGHPFTPVTIDVSVPTLVSLERRVRLDASDAGLAFASGHLSIGGVTHAIEALPTSDALLPVEGRLVLTCTETATTRLLAIAPFEGDRDVRERTLRAARDAVTRLRALRPAMHASFDRFVREIVLVAPGAPALAWSPRAIGVITLDADASEAEALRTFVAGGIEQSLACLVEYDRLFRGAEGGTLASRIERLRAACVETAWASIAEAARDRGLPLAGAGAEAYARTRERVGEVARRLALEDPTEVGMGIVDELARFARGEAS